MARRERSHILVQFLVGPNGDRVFVYFLRCHVVDSLEMNVNVINNQGSAAGIPEGQSTMIRIRFGDRKSGYRATWIS
jgi:hypothetical protein